MENITHGLRVSYQKGCRCDDCRQAEREYSQARRERNPEMRRQEEERARRWRERHPERAREQRRKWREAHPEHAREIARRSGEAFRLREKGIAEHERDRLFSAQGGVCAICGSADTRALSIDHDHETGRVRGLLCRRCNMGLGCFGEDAGLLRKAAAYVDANAMSYSASEEQRGR